MSNARWTKTHRILSIIRRDIIEFPLRITCLACVVFPIKKNKILIDYPNHRETIAVVDRLKAEKGNYDIVIASDQKKDKLMRYVKPDTLKYIYELATSGIWIDSARKKNWVHKRKQQLYIQTWHGAVAMKKVEKDAEEVLPGFYVKRAIKDSRMADYIVAETKQFKDTIKRSFWFDGKILEGEFKDGMFDPVDRDLICNALGIESASRIVLYAPTFRLDGNVECYDLDYERLLKSLKERTGESWKIIIRLHPAIADKCESITYSKDVINGTRYPKLGDLIALSDIVMTDYSSCMFYGYRAMKPVFIYASDFEDYMLKDRGGYFRYEELPAPVAKTTEELIAAMDSFKKKKYEEEVVLLNKRIGYFENDVMDQIIEIINNYNMGRKM